MSALRLLTDHPRAWTAARWLLGIGVLALLILELDGPAIVARIASANGPLVIIGVLGLTAVHALGAAAWAILCCQLGGLRLGWTAALRIYFAAQALGGVTPANIGGDAYRVVAVRNAGLGWSAAVAPVLVQRATSYLALAILVLPALAALTATSHLPIAILFAGLVACALAGGVALVLLIAPSWLATLRVSLPWPGAWRAATLSTEAAAWTPPPIRSVAVATGFGLAFHASSVLLTVLLVAAVDPSALAWSVLSAIVVARLSLAVPILPSGLGANEAILALLFAALGVAPEIALAALLLGRMALLLTTLVGASLLLMGGQVIPPVQKRQEARGGSPVTSR